MAKDNLDSWDDFTGSNFLKTSDVKDENDAFIVLGIEEVEDDKSSKPRILLGKGDEDWHFDLNVTNSKFCANTIGSPRKLIGKKMFFKKVMVTSPKTKMEVESLRVLKIE